MKKMHIGLRSIKTALSVFIAIYLYILLVIIDKTIGNSGDGFTGISGFYTPFFAGIAAAYTLHKDQKTPFQKAKIRSIGSVIGGYFGLLVFVIVEYLFTILVKIDDALIYRLLLYLFVSVGVLLLIHINNLAKQHDAIFISCLTFLSVTISIRNGGMEIAQFATNRIISTVIGVAIALFINNFRIHNRKNKNILMLANIDSVLDYDYAFGFTRYKLNDLYQRGAKVVLISKKRMLDEKLFNEVKITKPVILMDGVCIYETKNNEYIYSCDFDLEDKIAINNFLNDSTYDVFTYVIHDNHLVCHYMHLEQEESIDYYLKEKQINTYPFVNSPVLAHNDIAMFDVILKESEYEVFTKKLFSIIKEKSIIIKTSKLTEEYILIKIKPYNGRRTEAVKNLSCYEQCDYKVAFISSEADLALAKMSDFVICLANATQEVKDACDYIVNSNDFNDVLRLFDKIYYKKNVKEFLQSLTAKNSV